MHIYGSDQRRPSKERSKTERILQRWNTLVVAGQTACFLVMVILFSVSESKTFTTKSSIFFSTKLSFADASWNDPRCAVTVTSSNYLFSDFNTTIDGRIMPLIVSRSVMHVRWCLAAHAVQIVLGIISKLLFEFNKYEFRYRHFVVQKDVVTMFEIGFMVLTFVYTARIERDSNLIRHYLEQSACANLSRNSYPYYIPAIALYCSLGLTLLTLLISTAVALRSMLRKNPKDEIVPQLDNRGIEVETVGGEVAEELESVGEQGPTPQL